MMRIYKLFLLGLVSASLLSFGRGRVELGHPSWSYERAPYKAADLVVEIDGNCDQTWQVIVHPSARLSQSRDASIVDGRGDQVVFDNLIASFGVTYTLVVKNLNDPTVSQTIGRMSLKKKRKKIPFFKFTARCR